MTTFRPRIEPGSALLHYRLVERLGEGGMGVVWKAVDTTLEREVAIKILPEEFASDPERLGRFEREAKLLASLNHPNVASIFGIHEDGGLHFLAMELVRGRTLTDEIAQGLGPDRVVELSAAIADGLAAAHRQHVVHRDLKPDNIMIDAEGRPKILDFGLAKLGGAIAPEDATVVRNADQTRAGTLVGTVAYMSPEQAQGKPVDPRSDVFSLGIVLYQMATGRRPFRGDNSVSIITSILRDTPPPVSQIVPSSPAPLDRIIGRCLAKEPEQRYADASGLRDDLRVLRGDLISNPRALGISPARRQVTTTVVAAVVLVILAVLATWLFQRFQKQQWVRDQALPQLSSIVDHIQGLQESRESWDAYLLARKIDAVDPNDPVLATLRPKFTRKVTITSEPPGASVYAKFYDDLAAPPVLIGRTPLKDVLYPAGFTRIQLRLPGKETIDDVVWNLGGFMGDKWNYRFHAPGEVPADMSWIPPGAFELYIPGLDHLEKQPTAAFLMERYEVSNREYKKFVDAGGYTDAKYWKQPFVDGKKTLAWSEAIGRFVDKTGRPGPASWEVGSYPDGQADYPVSGVSWYEAAAYAEWAHKSLPTIFHWDRVAFTVGSSRIVPMSNLDGKGLQPVGSPKSMNRYGVADLAGNVREWAWNIGDSNGGRFILGGGWNDPHYAFVDAYAQPPFDRSLTNGFRCIKYIETEPNLAALQHAIERSMRDFAKEKPVSDELFAQFLRQFTYDKTPLNAKVEEQKETSTGLRQKITFDAAYGGERMMAYVFLPPTGTPPFQAVVVFPGSGVIDQRSSAALDAGRVDFVVKSGRAVIYPIFKGTFERGGDLHSDYQAATSFYRDYVVMWGKDLGRTIDYLETRKDIDASRIAYFGLSWGGAMGAVMPAVEKRIKVNVLYVAGLDFQRAMPEVDQLNYVTRVKQPTLMLNGALDFFFPSETSQKPMFELLGTPAADKKRLVFEGGHSVPRTETIRESLAWLDKYLGPVGRK